MEKIKSNKAIILAAVIVIAILLVAIAAMYIQSSPKILYPTEIRQYQGQNLSSINSVYENAIKGTQYINQTTYKLTVTGASE